MRTLPRLLSLLLIFGLFIFPAGSSASAGSGPNWVFLPMVSSSVVGPSNQGIKIDHTTADISKVPETFINLAKDQLRLTYGHTSHGSQVVSGMGYWSWANSLFSFNTDGSQTAGVLSLLDYSPAYDLGSSSWASDTRALLQSSGSDRNVVMWAWCGQLSWYSDTDVQKYLKEMAQLEADFPNVRFVYITGHTDGSGVDGTLNHNNNLIRDFAAANNKVLYDFADIETYDPAGNYYPNTTDSCPWCTDWCSNHPGDCANLSQVVGGCAHSHDLNCKIKGQAFWWMMARLAGWNGTY